MQEAGQHKTTLTDNITLWYVAVLAAAGILYVGTCAPTVVWQDSGMIQYRVWHNDIEGKLGLALSHPLFYIIAIQAKQIPFGEFAYRVNLITAIISAAAAANLFLLLRLWLGKNLPAFIGAISLALSNTFWQHATMPETYNLYIALLLAELIVILRYFQTRRAGFFYALGFLNGLAIADHMLALLGSACYAVLLLTLLLKKQISLKSVGVIIALWIIGAAPYEYLFVRNLVDSGDFSATISSAFFGKGYKEQVLNISLSARIIKENIMWILLNFPTPNFLLFFAGLFTVRKLAPSRAFANCLLAMLTLFLIFAFRYTIVDRYAFFIPFYCMVSIFTGLGAYYLVVLKNLRKIAYLIIIFTVLPIPVYTAAPALAKKLGITSGRKRVIPYRDDYKYHLQPWRNGYRGTERFADEAFGAAEPSAVIYADGTTAPALLYAQEVRLKRGDIKIISSVGCSEGAPEFNEQTIEKLFKERAIYVVTPMPGYCPDYLLSRYDFIKAGPVYRAVCREADKL